MHKCYSSEKNKHSKMTGDGHWTYIRRPQLHILKLQFCTLHHLHMDSKHHFINTSTTCCFYCSILYDTIMTQESKRRPHVEEYCKNTTRKLNIKCSFWIRAQTVLCTLKSFHHLKKLVICFFPIIFRITPCCKNIFFNYLYIIYRFGIFFEKFIQIIIPPLTRTLVD